MKHVFSVLLLCWSFIAFSQKQDTTLPAYQRYPTVPGLQLFLMDSTKYTKDDLPKKKQLLLMLFSPDCDHCQKEAEQIVANKDLFKDKHIVMVSTYPISRIKEFAEKYKLNDLPNVVMTKDPYYLLISFYAVRNLPHLALYDKKQKLIRTFAGSVGSDLIVQAFRQAD